MEEKRKKNFHLIIDMERTACVITRALAVGMSIIFCLVMYNFVVKEYVVAMLCISVLPILAGMSYLARKRKQLFAIGLIIQIILFIFFTLVMVKQKSADSGTIFWYYTFLITTVHFSGRKLSLIVNFIALTFLILMFSGVIGILSYKINTTIIMRFSLAYLVVFSFLYYYEIFREKAYELIGKMSSQVLDSADILLVSSNQLHRENTKLSSIINEQNCLTNNFVGGMDKIKGTITQTNNIVENSKNLIEKIRDKGENAEKCLQVLSSSVNNIKAVSDSLNSLTDVVNNIWKKNQVIYDIVFQTKILSFNAAIEAARAGNYGLGFAVVADEIHRLAEESGASAADIEKLMEEGQVSIGNMVGKIQQVVADVRKASEETVKTFADILQQENLLRDKMKLMYEISVEQTKHVEEGFETIKVLQSKTKDTMVISSHTLDSAEKLKRLNKKFENTICSMN